MKSLFVFFKLLKRSIYSGIKLNLGSSNINNDNKWIATDINTLNILIEDDWRENLLFFKADNLMAEHVWEHFLEDEIKLANTYCYRFLKKKGKLRLAVPDGFSPNKEYLEYVRPGGTGPGADDHKILFNYKTLKQCLSEVGFKINLLEYWDELGKFHYQEWDVKDGYIIRSSKHDKRNKDGLLRYTSLIVDAIKE
jgi:predicted SAM-dependent methyltransferase